MPNPLQVVDRKVGLNSVVCTCNIRRVSSSHRGLQLSLNQAFEEHLKPLIRIPSEAACDHFPADGRTFDLPSSRRSPDVCTVESRKLFMRQTREEGARA
ncbi:hypothetical protein cyc_02235 [Cyclospora cayetanensis]|uniref:Uncharacterized protein n=1 Tax=Cyclospora cayetanensis TaxID=88456 RepID=A0A1D3D8T2_9EIME|nr:hypothetical protein cyc_02235 [Cyclospora cayetanensis]